MQTLTLTKDQVSAVNAGFEATFGALPDRYFSAPGRTEIGGNHTDHQRGRVLAAAVNLDTIAAVRAINPEIMVLQGAGISNGQDVYNTIKLGAQATGSTSGIIKAADPYAMVEEMLYSLRKAWDELH